MSVLSVLLRIFSISAAGVVVMIYIRGGNRLKETENRLQDQVTINQHQQAELQEKEERFQKTKERLDTTTLELATFKRDKRLSASEVIIVKQELEKVRQQLDTTKQAKLALADENENLLRETINLKAQGFDPAKNPRVLTAQIEDQRAEIHQLETQLNDAQTVINDLFASQSAQNTTGQSQRVLIQRVEQEHQILVLEIGTNQGVRENAEFSLLKAGTLIAKVKVLRVTPDLCIVNILASDESGKKVLQPGKQIEYML